MQQNMKFALVLFASVAVTHCSAYGIPPPPPSAYASPAAPAASAGYGSGGGSSVQQVSLAGLSSLIDVGAIEKYLQIPAPSAGYASNSGSYAPAKYEVAQSAPVLGPVSASGYSAAPAAPIGGYGAAAPAPISYGPAIASGYGAAAPSGYGAAAPSGYGAAAPSGYGAPAPPKYSVLPAIVTQINPGKTSYKTYQTPIQFSTVTLPVVPSSPVANLYVPEKSSYGGGYGGAAPISVGGY